MSDPLAPDTVVAGPFFSDESQGVGVIVKPNRNLWTRVLDPEHYVPVKILHGDRASGGYRRVGLTPLPQLQLKERGR